MVRLNIVGIALIRNEDLCIGRVVANIAGFCDRIIIADHQSSDNTPTVVAGLAREYPHIEVHSIAQPSDSHELIRDLAGTPTWVFGVDGDEIYDPAGLKNLRAGLLAGQFDNSWLVFGNVLNCVELSKETGLATGYLAPPCRSMTKLYNFNLIDAWDGPCTQRLHGGAPQFRAGFDANLRRKLHTEYRWEESPFRCLHLCWLPRSSGEPLRAKGDIVARRNVTELGNRGLFQRLAEKIVASPGASFASKWKRDKYMRGDKVTKDIHPFFVDP